MRKIIIPASLSLLLVGCQNGIQQSAQKPDWIEGEGCERYFSETPYDLKRCQTYVKEKSEQKVTDTAPQANTAQQANTPVTQTAIGTEDIPTEGIKDFENVEDNIIE